MRKYFAELLHRRMTTDSSVVFITADLGFGLFDKIRQDFPDRFINTGACEQAACGIAVGLALSGKVPVLYSITPFLLYRAAETIRIYINHEQVPVKLIGSGRDDDYKHDGFSHYAGDDAELMQCFQNIRCKWPVSEGLLEDAVKDMFAIDKPYYINLKR